MRWQAQAKETVVVSCKGRGRGGSASHDQGAALVTTLLLLFLMSVMGLAAVLTSSSDMFINGYYSNFRGSFYAADSGLAIARQQFVNKVISEAPATFAAGTAPLTAAAAGTAATDALTLVTSSYANNTSLNTGTAANSWAGQFKIQNPAFGYVSGPTTIANGYQYVYSYSLTSVGAARGSEQATSSESGNITITAIVTPAAPSTVNFAAYGMFIDQQPICSGSFLVPGLISGPVFTNGAWTFGTGGTYTFTDQVGQHGANAGFQNGGCTQSTAGNANGISPTYQAGHQWGQNSIPLPTNDFNQKLAVVDGIGNCPTGTTCPTSAQLTTNPLKTISGSLYPSSGTPSQGVYLPYQNIAGVNTFSGGGIMVQGDAQVTLTTGNASGESANTQQIITIKQGSGGSAVTTTITIDPQTNTTKAVDSLGNSKTLAGVPTNCSMVNPAPTTCNQGIVGSTDGTMVYVAGNVTSLSGPSSGPAVANASAISITALNDITITGAEHSHDY